MHACSPPTVQDSGPNAPKLSPLSAARSMGVRMRSDSRAGRANALDPDHESNGKYMRHARTRASRVLDVLEDGRASARMPDDGAPDDFDECDAGHYKRRRSSSSAYYDGQREKSRRLATARTAKQMMILWLGLLFLLLFLLAYNMVLTRTLKGKREARAGRAVTELQDAAPAAAYDGAAGPS